MTHEELVCRDKRARVQVSLSRTGARLKLPRSIHGLECRIQTGNGFLRLPFQLHNSLFVSLQLRRQQNTWQLQVLHFTINDFAIDMELRVVEAVENTFSGSYMRKQTASSSEFP